MMDDYDTWFRKEVRQALNEADDPRTEWVSHDQVKADMAAQREALQRRIGGGNGYTRCGTPLVYAGRFELQREILAELGEQKKPEQDTGEPATD